MIAIFLKFVCSLSLLFFFFLSGKFNIFIWSTFVVAYWKVMEKVVLGIRDLKCSIGERYRTCSLRHWKSTFSREFGKSVWNLGNSESDDRVSGDGRFNRVEITGGNFQFSRSRNPESIAHATKERKISFLEKKRIVSLTKV